MNTIRDFQKSKNRKQMLRAFDISEDYFHALGGSAVPYGVRQDSRDSAQYVSVRLLQKYFDESISYEPMNQSLLNAAKNELPRVDKIIDLMNLSKEEVLECVASFIEYIDEKTKKLALGESVDWEEFKLFFNGLAAGK